MTSSKKMNAEDRGPGQTVPQGEGTQDQDRGMWLPGPWLAFCLAGAGGAILVITDYTIFFFPIRILGSPAVSQMTCSPGSVGGSIYTAFSFLSARHTCRLPGHGVAGELPHAAGLCPHLYRKGIKNRFPFHTLCCYFPASEEWDILALKGKAKGVPPRENEKSGPLRETICSSLYNHSQVTIDDTQVPKGERPGGA